MAGTSNNNELESVTVSFGAKFARSDQFKAVFREGMALVEAAASYLDGDGRKEARKLRPPHSLAYATESMRLTTRLMQLASWLLIRRANQYIEGTAPWKLAKESPGGDRLAVVLNALLESVRLAALLLTPVMPGKCRDIRSRLNLSTLDTDLSLEDARWAPEAFRPQGPLVRPEPLFPRIDAE